MREKTHRPDRAYAAIPNAAMRDRRLSAAARGVLAYLMTHADDWDFYPSVIKADMCLGKTTYDNCMRELRHRGYLKLKPIRKDGKLAGKQWLLIDDPDKVATEEAQIVEHHDSQSGRQSVSLTVGETDHIRRTTLQENQTGRNQTSSGPEGNEHAKPCANHDEAFLRFWAVYPIKKGKADAKRNFIKAVKGGADPEAIIAGAKRYAKSDDVKRGFAKHPQGWISGERWEDEDLKSHGDDQSSRLRAIREQAENFKPGVRWADPSQAAR